MSLYDEFAQDAIEILTEFGGPLTLKRLNPDVVRNPAEGTVTRGPDLELEVLGVMLEIGSGLSGRQSATAQGDGSVIQVGDMKIIIDARVAPANGDRVFARGKLWSVVRFEELNPAGTPVLYFLQVRA